MKNEEMSLRTKKNLAAALKVRMERMDFQKIKVSDLLRDCDISRTTFYYYFADIYELLEWMLETEGADLLKKCDESYTWDQGVLLFMQYCAKNSKMCLCCLNSIGRAAMEQMFFKDAYSVMERYVENTFSDIKACRKEKEFIIEFYVRAYASSLVAWLTEGMKKTPEEMLNLLDITVKGGLEDALRRSANK